jgi:oligo-1,6-glucosidase
MFEHVETDTRFIVLPRKFDLRRLKKVWAKWQNGLRGRGWNSLYYENHDQPRSLPRFTGDFGENRTEAAKMLAVSYQLLQGTPYVYQGQEIGMSNYPFAKLSEMKDVFVTYIKNALGIFEPLLRGLVFKVLKKRARDNARTPVQWENAKNAGFTTGTPWLNVNPNYQVGINVKDQEDSESESILKFYRKLIEFRKGNEIVKNGTYIDNDIKNKNIWCYERNFNGQKLLVICNFKNKAVKYKAPSHLAYEKAELKLHNYGYDVTSPESKTLRPYEALVFLLS